MTERKSREAVLSATPQNARVTFQSDFNVTLCKRSAVPNGREQLVVMNDEHDHSNQDEEAETMAFEPGDVVYLKSGSQALTVVVVDEDNIECVWISDSGEFFRETIPSVALTKGDLLEDDVDDEEAARRSA